MGNVKQSQWDASRERLHEFEFHYTFRDRFVTASVRVNGRTVGEL
jgi:hypothetical protein